MKLPPQMLRVSLEELALQIRLLGLGKVGDFLGKAVDPPSAQAIENAVSALVELSAIDEEEDLTPLGFHLAKLPVDARIGKMVPCAVLRLSCWLLRYMDR